VLDMPNNLPITMSTHTLRNRIQLAAKRIFVNVGFYSEFPTALAEIENIAKAGAVGFKLFLAEQTGGVNIDDNEALKEAFTATAKLDMPVAIHAEDRQMLKKGIEKLKLSKCDDITAFLKAHEEHVESTAINRILRITAPIEKMRLHFCHLSTQAGFEAIIEAKKAGKIVSCEVTPHNLLLTKDEYEQLGMRALTTPPLRTKENVDALWRGIIENVIDCIGSDHAPHSIEEKESRTVWDIKVGVPGLETTLPLILTLVHRRQLSLTQAVRLLSERPAQIFGLVDRGILEQGKNADLVVVDFNAKYKIDTSKFQSKAKYSPFNDWDVQGKPVMTFVNGQIAMENQQVAARAESVIIARGEQK